MAISLKVMAYNTHLFGNIIGKFGVGWYDADRFEAMKDILENMVKSTDGPDIISFEEIWSSDFVHTLHHDSFRDYYPNHYYNLNPGPRQKYVPPVIPSNPSGLLLAGNSRLKFETANATYTDNVGNIAANSCSFDPQDICTGKGFLIVPATIDNVPITIINTHMPTNSGTFLVQLDACFYNLAQAIMDITTPVILLGDFNLKEDAGVVINVIDRYAKWVGPDGYLGQAGMTDVFRKLYPSVTDDPGFSVIGNTNNCWKHFNEDDANKGDYSFARIDYVMCKGMTPVSMEVLGHYVGDSPTTPPDYSATGKTMLWVKKDEKGGTLRDISDHYPVAASLTIP